jgi:AraC family L-rhamnose operon regulatory protein RhaS
MASVEAGELEMVAFGRAQYPGRRLPRGVMPGLRTLGFFNADRRQGWGTGWHYNEGVEVSFVENGRLDFMTDDEDYVLHAGDLTCTQPWQRHCLGAPNVAASRFHWFMLDLGVRRPSDAWRWPPWIILSARDKKRLSQHLRGLANPVLPASPDLGRCFRRIGALIADECSEDRFSLLAVLVNEVLALLLEQWSQEDKINHRSQELCLQTVEQFWRTLAAQPDALAQNWSLPELARRCGFGVTQFVLYTRTLTNLPPMHYLRQCRLELAAKLLLEHPQKTVTEVALDSGFSSGQHFATVFRQRYQCSPQVFRSAAGK